jgi:DNA-binding response OmpR family regulator
MKILVVDDEPDVVESVRLGFTLQWRDVDVLGAGEGQAALDVVEREHPDIVLLDVGLPGIDGYEVLRQIRAFSDVPVVMLTARDDAMDKVKGLELGADDYVTKPFNPRTLVARVKAILRRSSGNVASIRPIEVGALRIEPRRREATIHGRRLVLRPREFDLLAALARDPEAVLTRDALLETVWGTDFPGETRTVDVHIAELRKQLGDDGPSIETIRGYGYRLLPGRA